MSFFLFKRSNLKFICQKIFTIRLLYVLDVLVNKTSDLSKPINNNNADQSSDDEDGDDADQDIEGSADHPDDY